MLEKVNNQELQTTGRLKEIEVEVKFLGEQTARNFIEMGRLLSEAKEKFFSENKTGWEEWISKRCLIGTRTGRRFVRIYEQFRGVATEAEMISLGVGRLDILCMLDNTEEIEEILTEEHLIGDKIKKATDLSREELRQVVNEKKLLQKALEEKEKAIADMKTEVENAKKRSSDEVIKASEKAREIEKRNAMRLLEQWKLDNEKEAKERQLILIQEQKKVLAEKKKLEEEKQKLMQSEAEFKGKEKRLILIENQLLNTTNEISKLSQDKEEVLKDIQNLKDVGEFYQQTKDYLAKLVNITHNPVYYKYFGEKEVGENLNEIISILENNVIELKRKIKKNEMIIEI